MEGAGNAHHIVVNHDARLITRRIKFLRQKYATTPYSKHIEISGGGAGDQSTVPGRNVTFLHRGKKA